MFVALGTYYLYLDAQYKDRVYPHVLVNGVDFTGMTQEDIQNYYTPINSTLAKKEIVFRYKDTVATFSGELLKLKYDTNAIETKVFTIGRSPYISTRILQRVTALFNLSDYSFTYQPQFTPEPVHSFLKEMSATYSLEPKNALFEIRDGRVVAFKPEEAGRIVDIEDARQEFLAYIDTITTSPQQRVIYIQEKSVQPDITLANVNTLGIVEKIGEGRSNYTGSSSERAYNVKLAASRFHGVLIPPGQILSYNNVVGEVSRATGFKTAYVIKNGRTVLGDGGGVCQDSTTLFRAALDTGLPIIERKAHAYRVKYYENDRKPGFDATVFSPSVDFKFKNDTDNYILIETVIDEINRTLVFELWGKRDGRIVELSDAVVYDHRPAPEPLYQDDPTLPRGVTKQVDWAAPGAKSHFTYKVTLNGEILQDQTFYSTYRPWQAVFLVGTQ